MKMLLRNLLFCLFVNIMVEAEITVYSENWLKKEEFRERDVGRISFPAFFTPYKKGVIYLSHPVDGCSAIRNASGLLGSLDHFVLIGPHGCPYETKVLNARDGGYAAALVARPNNETFINKDQLVPEMPVLFITDDDYKKIKGSYVYRINPKYRVLVTIGETEVVLSVLVAGVVIVIGIGLAFFAGKKGYHYISPLLRRRRRNPTYRRGGSVEVCSICCEYLEDGQRINEIHPCLHLYHKSCITPWLDGFNGNSMDPFCPVCRQLVESCRELPVVPTEATPLLA